VRALLTNLLLERRLTRRDPFQVQAGSVSGAARGGTYEARQALPGVLVLVVLACSPALDPPPPPKSAQAPAAPSATPLFEQGNATCDKRMAAALSRQTTVAGKLELYEHACALGCAVACDGAGTLLRTGPAELQSDERAAAYYERACAAKAPRGCVHLGELRERGQGTARSLAAARQAYDAACDLGDGDGCAAHGELLEAEPADLTAAFAEYTRGCALDSGRACARLAGAHERGDEVTREPARAVELYQRACELKSALGCIGAARLLRTAPDGVDPAHIERLERAAATLAADGCNDGEGQACALLGDAYRDGAGVEQDVKRAAWLYALGCKEGVEAACEGLKRLPATTPP